MNNLEVTEKTNEELIEKLKKLQESENRYKTLFNNAQVGMYRTTPDGQIIKVNPRLLEILGYSSLEQLLSRNLEEGGFSEKSPRSKFKNSIKFNREVKNFESTWLRFDGEEVNIRENARALKDENGEIIYYDGTVEDITNLKAANKKIKEQAALLDIATDAIFVVDSDDKIQYWNKSCEELYGLSSQDVKGKKSFNLIYKENDKFEIEKIFQDVLQNKNWNGELKHYSSNGDLIFVESRWTLILDEHNTPKSIFIVNTDITDKKELELQFYNTQKMESLGEFAAGISHHLNNIMQPLVLSSDVAKKPGNDDDIKELFKVIDINTERTSLLLQKIHSFAKGIEGITGNRILLDVNDLVDEIIRTVKEEYPKSIKLAKYTKDDLWNISAEVSQIRQIFINILTNAKEAMPGGGEISISTENIFIDEDFLKRNINARIGPYVEITIKDNGSGINTEIISRIYEPFYSTKAVEQHIGLGLSTVYAIVKGHGGFMDVKSNTSKGSKFKIYLPAKTI